MNKPSPMPGNIARPDKIYQAIGLMSGTSLDGIDLALIETDGRDYVLPKAFHYVPYDDDLRQSLRKLFGHRETSAELRLAEKDMTWAHVAIVKDFLQRHNLFPGEIDVIGFHGQTVSHAPQDKWTWQIGDASLLARETGIPVVSDMRRADVAAGGEGAPLLPLYHQARVRSSHALVPVAVLNIGGVSNVTWVGEKPDDILAFDTGPGNALMDDVVLRRIGAKFDEDALLARQGDVDDAMLESWLAHDFFKRLPPKSLDRNDWDVSATDQLPTVDAIATLAEFTVRANARASEYFPAPATAWYVTGGGRHNPYIMQGLQRLLRARVKPVEAIGWNGDALEAEGFAYLAVRHLLDLPLSLPSTTGVPVPQRGGMLVMP